MKTFYWHDYETWGINPSVDRPSQFAGVRTDENLNIISEPLVIYCQPCEDVLPHPEACLVTGITPQKAAAEGLPEREFMRRIHKEFATPKTCAVGYNSIRFDDEVTRYSLYRNFYDPYEREWRNGNSRWDIIDMVRLVYALRPDGIEWPSVDGKPSFKLELLTEANGISHAAAHDAYSDVAATIEMAKLIKTKKPALYDYVYGHKSKQAVGKLIDIQNRKPLLHISSKFPSVNGCAGLIVPLAMHPLNKNAVIVYELSVDPSPLDALSVEEIHRRVFTSQEALGDVSRLPIKLIHLNKCPILATPKLLDSQTAERLKIDKALCEQHWHQIKQYDLEEKMQQLFELETFTPSPDPEARLYDGFVGNNDKYAMADLRKLDEEALAQAHMVFEDDRLQEMFERYRARNAYHALSMENQSHWAEFVRGRLTDGGEGVLSIQALNARIHEIRGEQTLTSEQLGILDALLSYGAELGRKYGV